MRPGSASKRPAGWGCGFTKIQVALLLGVILILTAVLMPVVKGYLDQARRARATDDVRAIAQAYQLHKRDTGQFPIYTDRADSEADTPAATDLVGPGNFPNTGMSGFSLTDTADLEAHLNANTLGLETSDSAGGGLAYHGPYLESLTPDPWGNAYIVTADNAGRNSTHIGYVVSAGPNATLETKRNQTGTLIVSGDDIAARFQ